jgi:hypothetical protein
MKVWQRGRNLQQLVILHPASLHFSFSKSALEEYLNLGHSNGWKEFSALMEFQCDDQPFYARILR